MKRPGLHKHEWPYAIDMAGSDTKGDLYEFKPYAGVYTAILLFTKTNCGGTNEVWFYDMQADGCSLDDKRTPFLNAEAGNAELGREKLYASNNIRKIVYTDFKDEVLGVREEALVAVPRMASVQYAKKVEDYLRNHLNYIAIRRLRCNQSLTELDLKGLETALAEIGKEEDETLLSGLLVKSCAPSLAHFVRGLVGMDRSAAQAAFSRFLGDRSLTPLQIRFIELIIDQLTARGVVDASALYEPPFSNLHAGGPDALFAEKENVIDAVFEMLESLKPRIRNVA